MEKNLTYMMDKNDKSKLVLNNIYSGDCSELLKDKNVFLDDSVEFIITSPPYADKRKRFYGSVHPDEYVNWFLPISQELKRILKSDGSFILNIKEHPRNGERDTYVLELILALKKQGWRWVEEYCWYKKNSYPGKWSNRFRDAWERCLHFTKNEKFNMYQDSVKVPIGDWSKKRFKSMSKNDYKRYLSSTNDSFSRNVSNWLDRKKVYPHNVIVFEEEHYLSNVIEFATVCRNIKHSAPFPIELPTWFLKLFTRKNDIVLDPFIGSGTTAIAAMTLGRNYVGIELNQEHVKQAEDQIEALLIE
jgi:site-specific DNA-methyltransferase (adenine-specific)/site-specific DNA-methyltransferase (cytosine-N4-specific)